MTAFAVGLRGIPCGGAVVVFQSILARSYNPQMIWIYAASIAANMVDDHPIRYGAPAKHDADTVRSFLSAMDAKNTVALRAQSTQPKPAFGHPSTLYRIPKPGYVHRAKRALAHAATACASASNETGVPACSPIAAMCDQYFDGMARPFSVQDRTVTSATGTPRLRSASASTFAPPRALMVAI